MSTELSKEDNDILQGILNGLEQAAITSTEVSMHALSEYVSSLSPEPISHLGRMFKVYGYAGVFLAVKDSFEQGNADPFYKYALGTIGYIVAVGTGCISAPPLLIALGIGALVEGSWYLGEWIAENQDNLEEKLKELLRTVGMEIEENTISVNYCPLPKYNAIYVKDDTCMSSNLTRTTAQSHQSPLALDLDGDGVETTTVESGVYFDHDDNGFAEKSGWVGKDDGLLVRDVNNNGKIDNGTELFGNNSVLSSGEKAANGFEALADLDSNNDGVFNSSDTAWNQVKVWKDANQNGEVDSGELLTLAQAGVSGINLEYDNATTTDENGNEHKQTGTFIKTDGTTGSVHDVWFDADYANTMDTTDVEISDTIAALPNIQDSDGNTALFWANGEKESIEMLIKAGAKTDIRNKNGSLYYQVDSIPILGLSTNL